MTESNDLERQDVVGEEQTIIDPERGRATSQSAGGGGGIREEGTTTTTTTTSKRNESTSKESSSSRKSIKVKNEIRRITLNFTPSWFSVNMGTGITSILLFTLPYQFKGLQIIANIVFALNVFLFLLFLGISLARYTIWPRMGPLMLFHPSQSLFLGTFAMGFATIVNMCALSLAPHWGEGFKIFTWTLWWIDSCISVIICTGLPFLQFTRHVQSLDQVSGIWLLPLVSPIVAASSGAIVAEILSPSNARLTLIVSYILWGMGFGTAFLIMSLYYARQAIYKIPPAAIIVSVFLPLGPCGQGAFGLLKLSSVLYQLTKEQNRALGSLQSINPSEIFSSQAQYQIIAIAIYAVSIPISLIIWGLGLFWLIVAISTLSDLAKVSKLQFNLGWWGFTFPLGVFCSATIQLSKELDSGAFRILSTILSLIEILLWLFIVSFTIIRVFEGQIFFSPCLAEHGGIPPKVIAPSRKYTYEPRMSS